VELGPVASDTIVADWGDAVVRKWDYFLTIYAHQQMLIPNLPRFNESK